MKTNFKHLLCYLILAAILLSCNNLDIDSPGTILNIELNPQQCRMVEKGNDFAGSLLSTMAKESENENLLISPFSLQILMGMLSNGASEEAYSEMTSVLGLNGFSLEEVNQYYATMITAIGKEDDPKVKLSMANSAWIQQGLAVREEFTKTVNDIYHSPVNSADFGNLEQTRHSIDRWADAASNGLIRELNLPLTEEARLVLANALYFAGDWTEPFYESGTDLGEFYREDGTPSRKVYFMNNSFDEALYHETEEFQRVELPFGNGSFSMIVALPKEGKGLSDVLSDSQWMSKTGLQPAEVVLHLPKFKIENGVSIKEALQEMGIRQLFQENNLPGIAEDLQLAFLLQNGHFEIEESGVKAAAVSSGIIYPTSPGPSPDLVKMNVNRPFAFAICENSSHAVLFAGKVVEIWY